MIYIYTNTKVHDDGEEANQGLYEMHCLTATCGRGLDAAEDSEGGYEVTTVISTRPATKRENERNYERK